MGLIIISYDNNARLVLIRIEVVINFKVTKLDTLFIIITFPIFILGGWEIVVSLFTERLTIILLL